MRGEWRCCCVLIIGLMSSRCAIIGRGIAPGDASLAISEEEAEAEVEATVPDAAIDAVETSRMRSMLRCFRWERERRGREDGEE